MRERQPKADAEDAARKAAERGAGEGYAGSRGDVPRAKSDKTDQSKPGAPARHDDRA